MRPMPSLPVSFRRTAPRAGQPHARRPPASGRRGRRGPASARATPVAVLASVLATVLPAALTNRLPAQGTPVRVTDLNTAAATSYDFGELLAGKLVGTFAVFLAHDGEELRVWRTDGSNAGTTLLRRVLGVYPAGIAPEVVGGNDRAFFTAFDGGGGTVLWTTDGTPAGTLPIGNGGVAPASLAYDAAADRCWFSATDPTNGRELWRSDGTAASTVRITQLGAGAVDGMPFAIKVVAPLPSGIYFAGQGPTTGIELWRISGVTQTLFANLGPGSSSGNPRDFCWSGDYLMCTANGSNGVEPFCVANGALQAIDYHVGPSGSQPEGYVAYQPALSQPQFWFTGTNAGGRAPVRYNPFSQTTTTVGNAGAAVPRCQFGAQVALSWVDPSAPAQSKLYAVGGAGSSATLLLATAPSDPPQRLSSSPPRLLQGAATGSALQNLHRSDGTVAGTQQFATGESSSTVVTELPGGASVLLGSGKVVGATGAPTPLVPAGVNQGSRPDRLASMDGGVVVFAAGDRPMRSDGTVAGTQHLLPNVAQQLGAFSPWFGGRRFFVAAAVGVGLYRTDGSAAGTVALPGVLAGGATIAWAQTGTRLLLFLGDNLYATDGVGAPVLLRTGLAEQPAPLRLGDLVLFRGRSAAHGVELWRTDGTPAGTVLVRDTRPGVANGLGDGTEPDWRMAPQAGRALFAADNGLGDEVWRTDGTTAGTVIVSNVAPGPGTADIVFGPTTDSGRVLFAATSPTTGRDLWSTDGLSDTQLLRDDVAGQRVQVLGRAGAQWLYTVGTESTDPAATSRVYLTGGTAATTSQLAGQLAFGAVSPGAVVATYNTFGGNFVFRAGVHCVRAQPNGFGLGPVLAPNELSEPAEWLTLPGAGVTVLQGRSAGFGVEPWRSDSWSAGTSRLLDVNPGSASSSPREFTHSGGWLYFTADDGVSGRELWRMEAFGGSLPYGEGCPGTGGLVPQITAIPAPQVGGTIAHRLRDGLPNSVALLALGLNAADVPLGGGCSLLQDALVVSSVAVDPSGQATGAAIAIPSSGALVGTSLYAQYAVLDPAGAFAALLSFSGGLRAIVGI